MTRRLLPYLFLLPALTLFGVYTLAPFGSLLRLIFFETDYITERFIGLGNFVRLFQDVRFWRSIGTSGAFVAAIVPAQVGLSLLIAMLVIDSSKRVQDITRLVFYVPLFASGVILAQVWGWIYHPQVGLANWLLGLVGAEPIYWFNGRWTALIALSTMTVLSSLGGSIMLFLATALGVPHELYESARIDGASAGQIRWRIVAPLIAPTVAFVILNTMLGTFSLWQPIYMLTNGGPDHGTETLMYSIYLDGFIYGDFGLAAVKTAVLFLLAVGIAIAAKKVKAL